MDFVDSLVDCCVSLLLLCGLFSLLFLLCFTLRRVVSVVLLSSVHSVQSSVVIVPTIVLERQATVVLTFEVSNSSALTPQILITILSTMRKGYKQPTKAQMAQIEEKKRIQQMATPPPPGTHNVVTQVYILVFRRESKRLERALLPAEFDLFVKGMDLKPSELLKEYFLLPMPVMDAVLPDLLKWMSEGASGKLEKIEVPDSSSSQTDGEENDDAVSSSSSSSLAVSVEETE